MILLFIQVLCYIFLLKEKYKQNLYGNRQKAINDSKNQLYWNPKT